jgi:CcmD family protein
MNPVIQGGTNYLWAAYIVVWVIHCGYILTLVSRGKRLERERKELGRN